MCEEISSGRSMGVDGETGGGGKTAASSDCGCASTVAKVHLEGLGLVSNKEHQDVKAYLIVTWSAKGDRWQGR